MDRSVTLDRVLLAREQRAARQKELLARYGCPLICFTMNIPGPVKNNLLIERGFRLGLSRLEAQLVGSGIPVLHSLHICADTGCEGYYVADGDPEHLKLLCMEVEQAEPLGRLFDMDVLDRDGRKMARSLPRQCLLCENPAQVCGRSRAHSVSELQQKVRQLLTDALDREDRQLIAQSAVKSLLHEVAVTPKPGLVDRRNSGSHRDMDIFTFLGSAGALCSYFETCAAIGQQEAGTAPAAMFSRLRYPGKLAEAAMYRETGGINTHKGAIFSLGVLCAAAGRLGPLARTPEKLLDLCGEMTQGLVAAELGERTGTAGERLYKKYGITGVRGQAQQGFPAVRNTGLPVLRQGLAMGLSMNDAASAALLHLITVTEDTNLISRSDPGTSREAVKMIRTLLQAYPYPSPEQIESLDRYFIEKNLSPGGSADLLSLTLFLHYLQGDNQEKYLKKL